MLLGNHRPRAFNNTVTNFKSIKYEDNGGLNPQSPYKKGMIKEIEFSSPSITTMDATLGDSIHVRNKSSFGKIAKPVLELDHTERASSVF